VSVSAYTGPHQGRKAFMLQSLPPSSASESTDRLAQASGFSLHAGGGG
jgi:hypothetical protein